MTSVTQKLNITITENETRSRPWAVAYLSHVRAISESWNETYMASYSVLWTGFLVRTFTGDSPLVSVFVAYGGDGGNPSPTAHISVRGLISSHLTT
jgi:hypothetical protein